MLKRTIPELGNPDELAAALAVVRDRYLRPPNSIFCSIRTPIRVFRHVTIAEKPRPWAITLGAPYPSYHDHVVAIWPGRRRLQSPVNLESPLLACCRCDLLDDPARPRWERGQLEIVGVGRQEWTWGFPAMMPIALALYLQAYAASEVESALSADWPAVPDGPECVAALRDQLLHAGLQPE